MIDRFSSRRIILNRSKIYYDYFKERNKKSIEQYDSPTFKKIPEDTLKRISFYEHTWSAGDRLYKLAYRYYGDTRDWWVILRFNEIGSEFDIKVGDVLKIPANVEEFIGLLI
jgi:nucleoid-associated protein YgaU